MHLPRDMFMTLKKKTFNLCCHSVHFNFCVMPDNYKVDFISNIIQHSILWQNQKKDVSYTLPILLCTKF